MTDPVRHVALAPLVPATCEWTDDDTGAWDTSCDNKHLFLDGGPAENRHAFCPYCGQKLVEVRVTPAQEDDDD